MPTIYHVRIDDFSPNMKTATATKSTRAAAKSHRPKSRKHHNSRKHLQLEDEEDEEPIPLEDDGMTTSFLQYWLVPITITNCQRKYTDTSGSATCEKQILVPNSSYLYCSEHCKRMDGIHSTTASYSYDPLSTPYMMKEKYPTILDPLGLSLPRYVPALKPTPPYQTDLRIPPKLHNARPDLDPTEWKPAEPSDSDDNPGGTSPINNESARQKALPSKGNLYDSPRTAQRARAALPSLSHASTATASSTFSSSDSSHSESQYSLVSGSKSGKSTVASATSTLGMDGLRLSGEGQLDYQKRVVVPSKRSSAASGSLKKLLAGDHGKRT